MRQLVLVCWALLLPFGQGRAQNAVCLSEGGEAPVAGWDFFVSPGAASTIIAQSTDPSTVHSGSGSVRTNGEPSRGKEFAKTCQGVITVDFWYLPGLGESTVATVRLWAPPGPNGPVDADEVLGLVLKNSDDGWFFRDSNGGGWFYTGLQYAGEYTHIVGTVNTETARYDLAIDGSPVALRIRIPNPRIADGVGAITFESGRAAMGTDSYIDDLVIVESERHQPNE